MKTTQTLIKVGHGAYSGANALRFCFSRAQAVRVLQARGLRRDKAREVVKDITSGSHPGAYKTVSIDGEVVEVMNADWNVREGHYDVAAMRKSWRHVAEA